MKLTKRNIDALHIPSKGQKIYWDSSIPNFCVRVTSTGVISYLLNYRFNGRERRYTIGRHGELTPTQARDEALRLKARIRSGNDPLAERKKSKLEPTFN